MINANLSLSKVIDLEKWENLQEYMSIVTKVAMIVVDYKGNPVTKHSGCHKFCKSVRSDDTLVKYCQKCDSRGGLEAVRLNKPYIYRCHYNIVDIAIPIIIDGKYIGAIMAGQVKLSDTNIDDILEQIVVPSKNSVSKKALDEFKEYYEELPVLSYKEVEEVANMLFSLSNYLIDEALSKNLLSEMYRKSMKSDTVLDENILNGYTLKNIEKAKKEISNAIVNAYVKEETKDNYFDKNISATLKPAIEYIFEHKSENITADKMAKICHISPSYFSRLFLKETGENFSTYVSKLKVEWAKKILEDTDMSINEISDELGFSESGYFIKIFKKYEGVTPSLYRKYCKKS